MSNRNALVHTCRWLFLVLVLLLGTMQWPVHAQTVTGSLQMECHLNVDGRAIPLAGDTYALVKIADVTLSGDPVQTHYTTDPVFQEFDCAWGELEDSDRSQAAAELARYVQEQHTELLTNTKTTDSNGDLTFSGLEPGLYLVLRTQVSVANRASMLDPFLVDIPTVVNGTPQYDVTAVPKFEYGYISLRPCNVTIYMGGNDGYDGLESGETTSLPKPMFVIQAPQGVDVEDLVLLYHDDPNVTQTPGKRMEWKPVAIGTDEEGNLCYRLDRLDGTEESFHIQYYADGEELSADWFRPELEHDLFRMVKTSIPLSEGEVLAAYVTGEEGSVFYPVVRGNAELTVRGVKRRSIISNPVNPVTRVFSQTEDIPRIPAKTGIVAVPEGTTYTLNETDIRLKDLHGTDSQMNVGLLFDDIMNEVYDRQSLLESQADARMPALAPGATRHFQSQYLDLVDMNNGNAWVMASQPVQVYWGYPDGTDENTSFTLWHFPGLHRDGTDDPGESGYDLEDILAVEPEKVPIENTPQGIRFTVQPGGFSPFVLIWEENGQPQSPASPNEEPPSADSQETTPAAAPTGTEPAGGLHWPFLPQTGDNSALGWWLLLLLVSGLALVGIFVYKKKKQH